MDNTAKLIERAEHLLAQAEVVQLELRTLMDTLREQLAVLCHASPKPLSRTVPPTPAPPSSMRTQPPVPTSPEPSTERRGSPRRKGNPVSVLVSLDIPGANPVESWIVDRSRGGLCLLLDEPRTVGTVLKVRPSKAGPGARWVQVEVRSCRPERSSFRVGCQFLEELSWSQLQLFG